MMERFEHGGDTYGMGDVIDFSASLNPLGMPVQIMRALKVATPSFSAYPDPHCRQLVAALAAVEGVPADCIVATAGSTDALTRIAAALTPRRALVCAPTYSGYEQALSQVDARIMHHSLVASEDFDLTDRVLDYIKPGLDAVFLCSPNNPTGRVIPQALLCEVLQSAEECGTWVVLDESYLDFTHEESAAPLVSQFPRLIVAKTFKKSFAMAGLRVGWCVCGHADVASRLRDAGMPWIVSTPSQVAALAALDVPDYLERTRDYVDGERRRLEASLRELGMRVVPSSANFILFQSPRPLYDPLLERGIVIRRCENFRGLDAAWFRTGIRSTDDDDKLIAALKEVCG